MSEKCKETQTKSKAGVYGQDRNDLEINCHIQF